MLEPDPDPHYHGAFTDPPPAPPAPRTRPLLTLLAVLLCVGGGWAIRVGKTLSDPRFDQEESRGLFKSDPGLLLYMTRRIAEADGGLPADFRADPRVAWPDPADLPAMFTVGQEFLVAWTWNRAGRPMPLHVWAVWVMGLVASLGVVGVFLLARELGGGNGPGVLGALLFTLTMANYRTLEFVLIREDLSLPLFALHLGLLARAVRVRSVLAAILAAIPLVGALATWHAMAFVVSLEALCVFAWFLRSGENPLRGGAGVAFLVVFLGLSLLVPVLRAKAVWASFPVLAALALLGASRVRGRGAALLTGLAGLAALAAGAWALGRFTSFGQQDYSHVFDFVAAKLRHFGHMPEDPEALSFEARLLWAGPFATGNWLQLLLRTFVGFAFLGVGLALAVPGWLRGQGDSRFLVLVAFALVGVAGAWLIQRLIILPGLVLPVVVAAVSGRLQLRSAAWVVGLALAQGAQLAGDLSTFQTTWYHEAQVKEIRGLVDWVEEHVPADEPVASDFLNSTAILAGTGNPILLQPKYETADSRQRIRRFLDAMYHGTPAELHALLRDEYRCRYLVVDRFFLWSQRYVAGVRQDALAPPAGSPAETFLSTDARVLGRLPGFLLRHRTPPELGTDMTRIYELVDAP